MIPKPVRRILYFFIFILVGLNLFKYVRAHTTQEVIAVKQYSRALLDGDPQAARNLVSRPEALIPFSIRKKRDEELRGEIRWVTYKVKDIRKGKKSTTLDIHQIIRLDRPGQDSFWGTEKVINKLQITMVSPHSHWKVSTYRDNFYFPGMKN